MEHSPKVQGVRDATKLDQEVVLRLNSGIHTLQIQVLQPIEARPPTVVPNCFVQPEDLRCLREPLPRFLEPLSLTEPSPAGDVCVPSIEDRNALGNITYIFEHEAALLRSQRPPTYSMVEVELTRCRSPRQLLSGGQQLTAVTRVEKRRQWHGRLHRSEFEVEAVAHLQGVRVVAHCDFTGRRCCHKRFTTPDESGPPVRLKSARDTPG